MATLEVFFDCSSPWTYLGFHNVIALAEKYGIGITWKPIIVGGVFNAVNRQAVDEREHPTVPVKAEYALKDLRDWARHCELTINFPPQCGHPVNAVKCMRACLVMLEHSPQRMQQFATAAFEALWRDGRDLARDDVLTDLCNAVGADAHDVLEKIATQTLKDRLRANTDELIARHGFGSPTFFVNTTDMYFGNDRLPLVEDALRRDRRLAT